MATDTYRSDIAFEGDLVATATGDIDLVDGLGNVKAALYRRLLTIPGSLIHRPNYGVGIKLYQNSVNTLATRRKIATAIEEQFLLDDRVKSVDGISFEFDDNQSGQILIKISLTLVGYDEAQTLTFIPFEG
jgi:phage baseplate assembly protein W